MDLVVESAVVPAIFADVDHALVAAIKSGVENPALRFRSVFHRDAAESLIPADLCCGFYGVKAPGGNFAAKISLGLLDADEGDAIPELELPRVFCRDSRLGFVADLLELYVTGVLNSP